MTSSSRTRLAALGPVAALLAVAVAACGGSHHAALPARAHVVFASDAPAGQVSGTTAAGGRVIASLGFKPAVDGFSFQNYGFIAGLDLDQHVLRQLFGDVVCATSPSDSCTLTPAAQNWVGQQTPQMWGGHCYGFSMTALRFFRHMLSPTEFGGSKPYSLSLTPALQSQIAYAMVSQYVPGFSSTLRFVSATQMVFFLTRALRNPAAGSYSILIRDSFGPGSDGHVVTPIGITDLGRGRYQILIYDSNHPGVTRAIDVNENTNSWRYELFPGAVWSGAGGANLSENPMVLDPLSWVTERHPCPFCLGAGTMTISLAGNPVAHGHLLITTSDGRHLGFLHGRFVSQIKGAQVLHPYMNQDWKAVPEPVYEVPARDHVTVTLEPSGAGFPQSVNVSGPGFGATVSNLVTGRSAAVQVSLAPRRHMLRLRALGRVAALSPTIELTGGVGRSGDAIQVKPKALPVGAALELTLQPATHRARVRATGSLSSVAVTLEHVGSAGSHTLQNKTVGLAPYQPITL